jgi:formylmethanofuran dehydrogenase subunit E
VKKDNRVTPVAGERNDARLRPVLQTVDAKEAEIKEFRRKENMNLKPVGLIHSPYKTKKESPPQGREEICWIEVFEEYKEGLKDIDGFSHLMLLYWLHYSKNYSLLVKTPWDSEPHGVFATRSPNRPNALGFSVVELIERKGNKLKVKGLDALEGTPLIDIKPYLPEIDAKANVRVGWVKETDFSNVYGRSLKGLKNVQ